MAVFTPIKNSWVKEETQGYLILTLFIKFIRLYYY